MTPSEVVGVAGLHFHDLRHTGNTMASDTGTSTKNLMARMGHDDEKAALRYQHRSKEADQAIADTLNALFGPTEPQAANEKPSRGDSELAAKLRALLSEHLGNDSGDDPDGLLPVG